jgi:uncharacterized phiE125 gp8 family phage protein
MENDRLTGTTPMQDIKVVEDSPTYYPVTLTEAKNYLKIDFTDDDTLITDLIKASTDYIENMSGGVLLHKRTVTQYQTGGIENISLLRTPVVSITSFEKAVSFDDSYSTVENYRLGNNTLYHQSGFFEKGRESDGYKIVYVAGIANDASVSTIRYEMKICILRVLAYLYENRQEYVTSYSDQGYSVSYNVSQSNDIKKEVTKILNSFSSARGFF